MLAASRRGYPVVNAQTVHAANRQPQNGDGCQHRYYRQLKLQWRDKISDQRNHARDDQKECSCANAVFQDEVSNRPSVHKLKLVPQPQEAVAFGFSILNAAPINSSEKSMTEPERYSTDTGSIST